MPLNIEFKSYEEMVSFLYSEKSLLFLIAYRTIKKSIKSDDEIAVVANLLVNESVFTIQIIREDWYTHLNTSLTYFEGLEDYETCQNIKELLDCL